jgi:hypothetical protein
MFTTVHLPIDFKTKERAAGGKTSHEYLQLQLFKSAEVGLKIVLADEPEETGYVDDSFLSTKFLFSPSFLACFVDVSEKLLDTV